MTLTGNPPTYTRGYSFTTHSQQQPNVPQPGDRIDAELDDISTAVNSYVNTLRGITNADGTVKNGSIGMPQFAAGVWDQINANAQATVKPFADSAADSAAKAKQSEINAKASATSAASSAQVATAAADTTTMVAGQANSAVSTANAAASKAQAEANRAANSATTSQSAMGNSEKWSDLSFKWAEYLAGPVAPAPPGWPEAIDDGLWSSKWWAIRAREIVGAWGGLYLGAYPSDPPMDPANPWPPGSLYYNTTNGQMLVWNGQQWVSMTQAAPSVVYQYVYYATAGQTDFSGPDQNGQTPEFNVNKPNPTDVHVNGVRLAQQTTSFPDGDFTVNITTSTLSFNRPLMQGSIVQWDFLVESSQLAPGSVVAFKLADLDRDPVTNEPGEFDGVTTTFPMRYTDPKDGVLKPCNPGDGVQLQLCQDGVMQEFGVDFHTNGSDMVFQDPPPPGTRVWCVWYQPGAPA